MEPIIDLIIDIWDFLKVRKKYWLAPLIITIVLMGALIIFTQGSVLAPFIYTIFEMKKIFKDNFNNIFLILFFSLGAEIFLRTFLSRRNFTKLAIFEFTEKLRTYFHVNKYGGIEKINLQPEFKCLVEGVNANDQQLFNFLYRNMKLDL